MGFVFGALSVCVAELQTSASPNSKCSILLRPGNDNE